MVVAAHATPSWSAAGASSVSSTEIERVLDDAVAASVPPDDVPGLVVALAADGAVRLSKGHGVADRATARHADPDATLSGTHYLHMHNASFERVGVLDRRDVHRVILGIGVLTFLIVVGAGISRPRALKPQEGAAGILRLTSFAFSAAALGILAGMALSTVLALQAGDAASPDTAMAPPGMAMLRMAASGLAFFWLVLAVAWIAAAVSPRTKLRTRIVFGLFLLISATVLWSLFIWRLMWVEV